MHYVIIGFGLQESAEKVIYEYEDIKGEPHAVKVTNINPYLVDASNIMLEKRRVPISNVLTITRGSQPTDGGNLLLDEYEKILLIQNLPQAENGLNHLRWAMSLSTI